MGLLLLRAGVGGALIAHGAQKLFGWFGGGGIEGTATFLGSAGFEPAKLNATLAGVGEAGSGALLALGLGTGPAAAAASATMVTASAVNAHNWFFATNGGLELPATYGLAASVLALTGPGRISLDHATGHVLSCRTLPVVVRRRIGSLDRPGGAEELSAATAGLTDQGSEDPCGDPRIAAQVAGLHRVVPACVEDLESQAKVSDRCGGR